jgi:elongation factor P--(R)-beta-lysine ligase
MSPVSADSGSDAPQGAAAPTVGPDLAAQIFRAGFLRRLRGHFQAENVLEVETPVLSRGISLDCHIDVFSTRFHPLGHARAGSAPGAATGEAEYFLQTSPEPHMKRLLCRGFPDIYQIGKAFRNGEKGMHHNPEFTMLEWYRKGFSLESLIREVESVCRLAVGDMPAVHLTYREAYLDKVGADPLELDLDALLDLPALAGLLPSREAFPTKSDALDFIMSQVVESGFPKDRLTFVTEFPSEQAAQARVLERDPRVAHRFEVYGGGMELGNGYLELTDPDEYERRFDLENVKRRSRGKPELPKDGSLLADLRLGLPPCAGVAIGLDRLVQLALGRTDIRGVMTFPWDIA